MSFGNVKGHLNGLSSGDALEGIFAKIFGRDALADTVKGNGVLYSTTLANDTCVNV